VELKGLVMNSFGKLMQSRDFKEGPLAFMEKRLPKWSGQ
jgi:hypothetical protein